MIDYFKESASFGAITFRNDYFSNPRVFDKTNWFIGDHFEDEVFETNTETSVHISVDIVVNQIGIITARDSPHAYEWRQ